MRWGFFLFLFFSLPSVAKVFHDLYVDGRARSLGMALTAFVDDYSALYRNPAGLALRKDVEWRFFDYFHGAYSHSFLSVIDKLTSVDAESVQTPSQQLALLDGVGVGLHARPMGFGLFIRRIAGGVHLFDTQMYTRIRTPNPLFASVQLRATTDSGFSVGYGQSFLNNKLRAGIAIRPILLRAGLDKKLESDDILDVLSGNGDLQDILFNDAAGFGVGADFDLGLQGELEPIAVLIFGIKPMAGIALQNVLATPYGIRLSDKNTGVVPPNERKLNVGVAAQLIGFGAFTPTLSMEVRDLLIPASSIWERFCVGAEVIMRTKDWFKTALRAHFARGNIGGGMGLKIYAAELELGTYAENLGQGIGVGFDRRYYASISTAW